MYETTNFLYLKVNLYSSFIFIEYTSIADYLPSEINKLGDLFSLY